MSCLLVNCILNTERIHVLEIINEKKNLLSAYEQKPGRLGKEVSEIGLTCCIVLWYYQIFEMVNLQSHKENGNKKIQMS